MTTKTLRVNYKSDFVLTLTSDAGWAVPFCIRFWTAAPRQSYFAGWDGETWTHCSYDSAEPTKLKVQFDNHRLTVGELRYEISYHFAMADFPDGTEDEVLNRGSVVAEVDGRACQVVLDFQGETAPEIQFALPGYANELQRMENEEQRIANEEQRINDEQQRISNEEGRISAEESRQAHELQRISNEEARIEEFAQLKAVAIAATVSANDAATLANEKAQLAADKAALAQAAATLANEKAQLAADKAALAQAAATIANEKAELAQQKAEYAQTQGDYAKAQGDYAKEQSDTAQADHVRAEADHTTATADHETAASDHSRAEADHTTADADHETAASDHSRAEADHSRAESDHETATEDHNTYAVNVLAAQTAAQNAAASAEASEQQATAAAESSAKTEQYVEDLKEAIEALPDGQAVSAQVAENTVAIAALQAVVADIETLAEGYVRVAGSSSPALSYKSYKYHEQGGFGRESAFSLFYPCLVGTKLSGDDTQVGTILFVLKKLGARVATAEDTAFTEGQVVWEDINGNLHAIDGSEGDVLICNIEPYYSIDGRHTVNGTEYDVFLKSRTPFTWQGIEAVLIDKMGISPDYCVSHQDEDNVVRMHSAYNLAWNGSYTTPVGVVGKYVYTTDEETGDIVETYDANETLLGGAGGLHSTDISLPEGEQRAMNQNPDTTLCYPFMNQTAEACNRMQALLLSEGGTFDACNANLMGSGFSTNDPATAAGDWEQSGSGAKNGMRFVNSQGQTVMRNFGYFTANTAQSLMLNINSLANMINSWRNPWHIMEAYRAVCHAIQNDVHELEWFTFEGNKYKYRSVSGFAGPSQGEATCVVWKMLSTKFTDAAKDPADGTTSLEGNRVDFLVSTALLHGVTTQVSPSWWMSGLIFTENENGQYECYIERDQHALLKSPSGDYNADQVIPFEEHYEHLVTIQKGEGYARNYSNEALMMPDTDANKSRGGLHTYVGKYNLFTGGAAPKGKKSVRGFRRGNVATYTYLSPLTLGATGSPAVAVAYIGFGTCCRIR